MQRFKLGSIDILFLFFLLFSLIIRFILFDYPLLNGETHRDYIVGRHMVVYGEIPLTGPCCLWNGTLGAIRNNPIYYYLVAFILLIKDDILFLGFVNILLQLFTIVIIYILAKKLFGSRTALIAALFFGVSASVLKQSLFFWQPHVMEPFANLSYLLLLFFYLKKNYAFLVASIICFLFAASLHNALYAILPAFAFLIFFLLKKHKNSTIHYLFALATFIIFLLLFYLPWILHLIRNQEVFYSFFKPIAFLNLSFAQFFNNLKETAVNLFDAFFFFGHNDSKLIALTLAAIPISFFLYIFIQKDKQKRIYLTIFVLSIIQFLVVISLFKAKIWSYYFIPIFGIFMIVIAESVNTIFSKRILLKAVKLILIVLLVKIFSLNFQLIKDVVPLENKRHIGNASVAIEKEILNIYGKEKFGDLQFFSIAVFGGGVESPSTANLAFWSILEKNLNTRFIKVIDAQNSYRLLNKDNYVFLICQHYPLTLNTEKDCVEPFVTSHKEQRFVKAVYNQAPFQIYLFNK